MNCTKGIIALHRPGISRVRNRLFRINVTRNSGAGTSREDAPPSSVLSDLAGAWAEVGSAAVLCNYRDHNNLRKVCLMGVGLGPGTETILTGVWPRRPSNGSTLAPLKTAEPRVRPLLPHKAQDPEITPGRNRLLPPCRAGHKGARRLIGTCAWPACDSY